MRMRIHGWGAGMVAALLVLAACQSKSPQLDEAAADAWARVLVGHTSGLVPRRSQIRVLFANDVAAAQALGTATLKIEPAVPGELALRGTRELVLVPQGELQPGRQYRVTLTGKDLQGVPQDLPPYQFEFHVQTPQYDLRLGDLESDPADDRRMVQRGVVTTADAESPEVVEQMLRASYRGTALAPTWTHSGDGREHRFALAGLDRQAMPEELRMTVAGAPIGAQRGEDRTVSVPPLGQFVVVNARALDRKSVV